MDENELNPTGLAGSADEDLQIIEDYLAGEQEDEEQDQGSVEQPLEQQPIQQDQDPLTVDGQDLRNHPDFELLRLDIPWTEEEERGEFPVEIYDRVGYHDRWQDRIKAFGKDNQWQDGRVTPIDNPRAIWLRRKHALTKEGDAGIEVSNAIKGGGLSLISSVLTAPERYADMTTGQMSRVDGKMIDKKTGKPYKPDWDPLGKVKNPWTNSWWGNLTEGVVHYGVGTRWALKGQAAAGFTGPGKYIGAEGIVAAISENSQGQNVTGRIVKKVPWTKPVIGLLAVGDYDHPLVVTWKNMLEEMGLGYLFDAMLVQAGKGTQAVKRIKNVDAQVKEKGKVELSEGKAADEIGFENIPSSGFRGSKNKPIADPWQGARTSTNEPFDIKNQVDRADQEWSTTYTGADSPFTEAQVDRMANHTGFHHKEIEKKIKELVSDQRYKEMIEEAKLQKRTPEEVFKDALIRHDQVLGRWHSGEKDIWKPITDNPDRISGIDIFPFDEMVTSDLINGSLFKILRNKAIAAREVGKVGDIFATDGPMQSLRDNLIIGLTNVKRSRYLWGLSGLKLQRPQGQIKRLLKERTIQLHGESKQAVDMMFKMLKDQDSDELADAVLDVFSKQTKIQNWMDFDAFMRAKLKGGYFEGLTNPMTGDQRGVLIKELQNMSVSGILSGGRTPIRAIMGTTTNAYLNSFHTFLGAALRAPLTGDLKNLKGATHNAVGMFDVIPDALKVFRQNVEANFAGDMANIKTRFSEAPDAVRDWELMGAWVELNGNWSDRLAYNLANHAILINKNKLFTWSNRVLGATDDTFRFIMAKARSKEKAFRTVYDEVEGGIHKEITPDLLKKAEDAHYNDLLDVDGNIDISKDIYLENKFKEVTLTTELDGWSKKLESIFNTTPFAKPFFLFARTGVNGLRMSVKNTPIIGAMVDESRNILLANADNLSAVKKYGIDNAEDLAQAKNLIIGRQVMGNAVVLMTIQKKLAGELTGSGPENSKLRRIWTDTGWQRNQITFGPVQVGYDAFEPYNLIMSVVSDVVDNSRLMGPQWTEDKLSTIAFATGYGLTNKSYLQGLNQFITLLKFEDPKDWEKVIADLGNNQVPLSSLRKDIAKVLNPVMREVGNDVASQIRNRNKTSEFLTKDKLAIKYDMLNGEPIRDWNIMEGMWNALSPVSLRLTPSPGRTLLWNSNYDMRMSVLMSPDGISLKKHPDIRSQFQQAIGNYKDSKGRNLEQILNDLAKRKDVQKNVIAMGNDISLGKDYLDPGKTYLHNNLIHSAFTKARNKAWASIRNDPKIQELYGEQKKIKVEQKQRREQMKTKNILDKEELQELINPPTGK